MCDDDIYVYENSHVKRGLTEDTVKWAFTTFQASNWHPLTWLSYMVDTELFGSSAAWHHRMNMLYHLLNTELLFLVLWGMTRGLWQSAFVAALFGVHPLHVESVAWIAERKDVLSTLFWILTMGAYLRYIRRPGLKRYLSVLVIFTMGLMCKPMLITLPFVLLLLDWWPLGRVTPANASDTPSWQFSLSAFSQLVWEKLPLLVLSAISSFITFLAQTKGGAVRSLDYIPFGVRISNALVSYLAYLWKMVWPSSLSMFYPHPASTHADIPGWEITGAVLLLGGLSFLAWWQGQRRPYLIVGWLWYLGTLVPVIGLVQVGNQAMADRYTYVPLIGLFIAMAWGIPNVFSTGRFRRLVLGLLGGGVVVLSVIAWSQTGYWRDGVTLFSRALTVTQDNWLAWNNLGVTYDKLGQPQQAITYYREALRIKPDLNKAWYNLGVAYEKLGQPGQAISYYREALRTKPDDVDAWNNLGVVYDKLGQPQQAIVYYREALRIKPDHADAWNNLGVVYDKLGQRQQAIVYYREALKFKPDYVGAWYNLGVVYDKLGQPQQAISYYREALRIKPDFGEAWNNLGVVYDKLGQLQQAVTCFREALRIKPDFEEARYGLGVAYDKLSKIK
ncbi:MAG TPA: tetratricopeptide repeat protein [Syntrophales bacterium]|nr:tetratricopeptide repeat protein [Syntrophales bacterium]